MAVALGLPEIARALNGQIMGHRVVAPGPNHSRRDRSLSVTLSDSLADGFAVHSFAGDDWRDCRDYVAERLGLAPDRWRERREPDPEEAARRQEVRRRAAARQAAEDARRQRFAVAMWNEARPALGTIVERYLNSRALDLPREISGAVLRWHPRCPWEQGTMPAMVSAIRDVRSGAIIGVHRTALDAEGRKLGRKVFGSATAGAVMLDPLSAVSKDLVVGEGIESCLSARQIGLGPVWSLISTANIGALPVLDGVSRLTVLAEVDKASNRPSATARAKVGERWHAARRIVDAIHPPAGADDLNTALMMGGAA